jgi:hypothetical protein
VRRPKQSRPAAVRELQLSHKAIMTASLKTANYVLWFPAAENKKKAILTASLSKVLVLSGIY